MAFVVIENKCVGCSLCKKTCSFGAIEINNRKAYINSNCTSCGMCVNSCKFDAIEFSAGSSHREDNKDILVFAEVHSGEILDVTYELVSKAKEIASQDQRKIYVMAAGNICRESLEKLAHYGADRIYYYKIEEKLFDEDYADILENLNRELKPSIILFGATAEGRSIAPRLASKLKTGLTADCTQLFIDDNNLLNQVRPAFGGNLMAAIVCPNQRPQMATVRPGVMQKSEPNESYQAEITERCIKPAGGQNKELIEIIKTAAKDNLSSAEIVVAAGKGIGPRKNMELIHKLADLLGGKVALSRPLVDMGYGDYTQQVGQTGQTISPKLYISFGVSGAIQHIAGIGGAETIIAVNTDKKAPIFNIANFGIIGEAGQVLKELIAALEN
ncbi:electron transfer flavoprotein subunit alpha [Anaeropeptidivorans aminofermentans]|jgi:electron transfer flavoprotein alpha subunit|uniref:electron transfer flavoprotein subunit alpha n=1 Tax=Anaeropeptidivorans aminofermentans TaxID=2934315 RepID=UPI0020249DFB|nr:electron transfer flavoprotein subunit alpha [Anaeropeptidivorans aminofermentans]